MNIDVTKKRKSLLSSLSYNTKAKSEDYKYFSSKSSVYS